MADLLLLVIDTVWIPAASISMDVPRVRTHRRPSPWRRGWLVCRWTVHPSVSLGVPSPSNAVVSPRSISSIHDRLWRPLELVGIQSERVDGRDEGRFEGRNDWLHVSVSSSFSPCACLSSSFSKRDRMVSLCGEEEACRATVLGMARRTSAGPRGRESERERERERKGCLFDGSIGPPTRSVEPPWWSQREHHPMKRRNDEEIQPETCK
mmetsp:Transcript_8095/g.50074  ORF Transcript_8095/g.50074 Transcript_8095/m.50074 type:complete len:209 (+) Transcript_8095:374-1000(+)